MRIHRSKRTGKDTVRPTGYSGTLIYGGIRHMKSASVKVSSLCGSGKMTISSGDEKHEITVPPCDSYDDTVTYRVDFSDITELKITLSGGMSIEEIETA